MCGPRGDAARARGRTTRAVRAPPTATVPGPRPRERARALTQTRVGRVPVCPTVPHQAPFPPPLSPSARGMASKKAALEAIRRIKEAKEKGGGIATRLEVGGRGGRAPGRPREGGQRRGRACVQAGALTRPRAASGDGLPPPRPSDRSSRTSASSTRSPRRTTPSSWHSGASRATLWRMTVRAPGAGAAASACEGRGGLWRPGDSWAASSRSRPAPPARPPPPACRGHRLRRRRRGGV
jgi:hypothetical protein